MASVRLQFTPLEGFTKLNIYEADTAELAPGSKIETVVVDPVDPISQYTTQQATGLNKWFSIQWEDASGGLSEMSNPIQGGTTTFIGEIIDLVRERDSSLDEQVVRQEAEAAIESFFGVDPYSIEFGSQRYAVKIGLARLVQARSLINGLVTTTSVSSSNSGWTAGLVSMKSGTADQVKQSESLIKWLLEQASLSLGLSGSRIAQMAVPVIAGGFSEVVTADISRLMIEVE